MRLDVYDAITGAIKGWAELRDIPVLGSGDVSFEPPDPIKDGMQITVEHDGCKHPMTYTVVKPKGR